MKETYVYADYCRSIDIDSVRCPNCTSQVCGMARGKHVRCACGATLTRGCDESLTVETSDPCEPPAPITVNIHFHGGNLTDSESFGKHLADALRKAFKEGK